MSTNTPPEEVMTPPSEGPKTAGEPMMLPDPVRFSDTPLEAAMRKAFDYPSYANIQAVAAEAIAHHEASKEKEVTPPQPEGVFKGAQGLQELHDCDSFWERQMYGTRFYFGDGGSSYLHRGVLRAFLEDYALAKSRAESAEAQLASLKSHLVTAELERDRLQSWKDQMLTVESWWSKVDEFIRNHPKAPMGQNVSDIALQWLRAYMEEKDKHDRHPSNHSLRKIRGDHQRPDRVWL